MPVSLQEGASEGVLCTLAARLGRVCVYSAENERSLLLPPVLLPRGVMQNQPCVTLCHRHTSEMQSPVLLLCRAKAQPPPRLAPSAPRAQAHRIRIIRHQYFPLPPSLTWTMMPVRRVVHGRHGLSLFALGRSPRTRPGDRDPASHPHIKVAFLESLSHF